MRTALITGASRGIGFAIARALSSQVEQLIIVARDKDRLEKAASQLSGVKVIPLVADLEKEGEIARLVAAVKKHTDSLDILVNNAGAYTYKPFEEDTPEEITKIINLNLEGCALLTNQLLPLLKKGTHAQIINISSAAATDQTYGEAIYAATKAGISALSNILRKELNTAGIRITTIQPWGVDTYDPPQPEICLQPDEIGRIVSFIVTSPPTTQIDIIELSHIKQWRGEKPAWID